MVRNLLCNYPPKPCNLPFLKSFSRNGNVITRGYQAWEPLQLSMHLKDPSGPSPSAAAASSNWVSSLVNAIWEQRVSFLEKTAASARPRSLAVLTDCAKNSAVFTDLAAPRSLPPGACSSQGIEAQIVGHGAAVAKVHLARTSSSKMPERVAWAEFDSVPAPKDEVIDPSRPLTTDLYLVVKDAEGGDVCITEVPLTIDGDLFSSEPQETDPEGNPLWRKIGPQDIQVGSTADAECMFMPASIYTDSTGSLGVSKRIVITALYFRVPDSAAPAPVLSEPPPILSRAATVTVLAGMKRDRSGTVKVTESDD